MWIRARFGMTLFQPVRRIVYILAMAHDQSFETLGIFQTPGAAAESLSMPLDNFRHVRRTGASDRWFLQVTNGYLATSPTSYWIFQGLVDHKLEVALQKPFQTPKPPWDPKWGDKGDWKNERGDQPHG